MTINPPGLVTTRDLLHRHLNIPLISLGIAGDDAHVASGNSYHLGKGSLRADSYSIVESDRDRRGLSEYASALDIGYFSVRVGGRAWTLRDFSNWLVGQCSAGASDTRDIREVIYSPDGKTVRRWDRLRRRTGGDDSHLSHTHLSEFRDARGRLMPGLVRRWLTHIGLLAGEEHDVSKGDVIDALDDPTPWVSAGVARAAAAAGWGPRVSTRALLEYAFSQTVLEGPRGEALLLAAVLNVDEEVAARLGAGELTAAKTADVLRPVLGERAAAVGRLLAGLPEDG